MKLMVWFVGIWAGIIVSLSLCKGVSTIEYTIYFDTEAKDTYEVKEELQTIYTSLVSGIHEVSYITMVLQNLDRFAYEDDMKADWKDNQLIVTIGDGEGVTISGELQSIGVCVPQVEPRSFLMELFFPS